MSVEENNEVDGESSAKSSSSSTLGNDVSSKLANIKDIKANIKHNISTLTKKPPEPDKNEPTRFLGEGVSYRAKLIGILEVGDARGDRMCQEALADLKMAIRAAGEHKQRITINIAIDGLRLRDDKSGDCLYHHPVHKISFIAQDMTDSRAFGYIFGSPDTGHRFFGIKTDKAASQVVISMRDLFQVVFELKKKEIEMAKQHIEQHQIKYGMGLVPDPPQKVSTSAELGKMRTISEDVGAGIAVKEAAGEAAARKSGGERSGGAGASEAIADLLDLELELNSIQQGISQMERITPSDPFGDSFAPPAIAAPAPAKLLPPPPTKSSASVVVQAPKAATVPSASAPPLSAASNTKNWFSDNPESLFNDDDSAADTPTAPPPSSDHVTCTTPTKTQPQSTESILNDARDQFDVFTELDPLGTGRSKPYIDKKDFFQELKNPPKKVLKDLVGELPKETPPLFQASFDNESISVASTASSATTSAITSAATSSTVVASINNGVIDLPMKQDPLFPVTVSSDPFGDDPFDKTDPFAESSLSKGFFPNMTPTNKDPFDTCFADFTAFGRPHDLTTSIADENVESKNRKSSSPSRPQESSDGTIHGPLRVSLPPEKQLSTSPRSRNRYSRTSSLAKLPSPKQQKTRSRVSRQATMDSAFDRNSPMDGMTLKNCSVISPSPPTVVGFMDSAPDPPPRPTSNTPIIKPPPLPPKRQVTGMTPLKQPFRPLQLDYDYIENYETLVSQPSAASSNDVKSPPIPVPARRPRFGAGEGAENATAPQRPVKHVSSSEGGGSEPEYYLTPFPLLPPPIKKNPSPKMERAKTHDRNSVKESAKQSTNTSSLDITLSQLSKTGFSDLASTLGMSPTSLSKMTLQELTKCLQKLSEVETKTEDKSSSVRNSIFKSEQYSALRESIEDDLAVPFKAEFDTHFNSSKESASVNEESLFDKYAVFRELLEQEKLDNKIESNEIVTSDLKKDEKPKVIPIAPLAKSEEIDDLPDVIDQPVSVVSTVSEDRYAALRDINFDDFIQEEEEEDVEEDNEKMVSLKEEVDEDVEEESRSRQHSESTESPTATMKEPQSIMETTIIEEDISALEADDDDVPEEEVMGEMELALPTVAESNESIDVVSAADESSPVARGSVHSLKEVAGEEDGEDEANSKSLTITNLIEGWAKFENNEKTSEGNVSPWSIDSKDINKETFWKERPDRPNRPEHQVEHRKPRKGRKHKTPDDDWGEDGDESEEGWRWDDGPWRENGWSDGESLYDEPPPPVQYHSQRRGRRRRASPRRKSSRDPSPWEDDERERERERESRWEDSRRVDDYRPKHRGSSLDEDRRKRRLSPWAGETDRDRRSSRESLAWEEEERYSRRPYRDRRHRRYEDQGYTRSREYRDCQNRRNYQYYRDRSHESPWEDSEQGEEDSPRCQTRKQSWGRQPFPPPHPDSEEEMYRHSRSDPRKTQTLKGRGNRAKKRGQTSPFEDDFSAHSFNFPSDSKSPGSDMSEQCSKTYCLMSSCERKPPHLSPDYYAGETQPKSNCDYQAGKASLETCCNKQGGGSLSKSSTNNHRQSPFEDDFTPPETRRYSGRSVSSDASDKSCRKEDLRCNDDVFIPEYKHRCEKFMSDISAKNRRGRNLNGDVNRSTTVDECGDRHVNEVNDEAVVSKRLHNLSEAESPSAESVRRRPGIERKASDQLDSPVTTVAPVTSETTAVRQQSSRRQTGELKFRVSSLRRTDSSSSLRKSESVNIFARSSDPFDDDDFFSADSSTLPRSMRDEKPRSATHDPFKWAEAFNAFNFDTAPGFFEEEGK